MLTRRLRKFVTTEAAAAVRNLDEKTLRGIASSLADQKLEPTGASEIGRAAIGKKSVGRATLRSRAPPSLRTGTGATRRRPP